MTADSHGCETHDDAFSEEVKAISNRFQAEPALQNEPWERGQIYEVCLEARVQGCVAQLAEMRLDSIFWLIERDVFFAPGMLSREWM